MVEASSSYDQCSTGWTAMIIVMMAMMEMIVVMTVMIILIMVMMMVMMAVMTARMVMIMAKDGGDHLPALCRFDDDDDGVIGTWHSPD